MKTLTLKLGGKTYTTSRITAYLSREAMAVNKDMLGIAKTAKALDQDDIDGAEKLMEDMESAAIRKANLICEVYGNKFTVDELERNLTNAEIDEQVNRIIQGISGVVEKN
ncbi:MAG TPA: hypothetical protein GX523_15350 [Desulfitobacterium dehalogenans]|uniref:Uncharacterized protein n=1 Tax=Desulfitobacterium dehalogenans TaxID=36854 RepID=A0A7C6Z622_9FIRM|nr:hypothetical protein [Desulfitobacterium dehalogenans]